MDISIIIPVYNEEGNIALMFKKIKEAFFIFTKSYEIIFVNDGSSDNSLSVLKDISNGDSSVRVISFDKNYGQTAALDAGFKYAKGEIVLTIDADLQYDPEDLLRIIKELEDGGVDAVFGRRINRTSGFIKKISSITAIFIRNIILREDYQDSSMAGYRKRCLKGLVLYKELQVFIPALLRMEGCRIKEIEVKEYPRMRGNSKFGIANRVFNGICALFAVKWMKDNKVRYNIVEKV
ncbi:MAG: glycosyltransferase family 2 protein [Candidatus Omnitrophota bacterium]|jgi:glycosyltransferase involved in cell wall biosynthesis